MFGERDTEDFLDGIPIALNEIIDTARFAKSRIGMLVDSLLVEKHRLSAARRNPPADTMSLATGFTPVGCVR